MTENIINHGQERWKPIKGFEGFYEVSDMGRVKRIAPAYNSFIGRIIIGGINNKGYRTMRISKNGIGQTIRAAKNVLEAFGYKKPTPYHQVNHKNGIKNDDRLCNLEWCTPMQNIHHAKDILGRYFGNPGEKNAKAKLRNRDIKHIEKCRKDGMSYVAISRIFNVTPESISNAYRGKTWKHHG